MSTPKDWLPAALTPQEQTEAERYGRQEYQRCGNKPHSWYGGGDGQENSIVGAYGMWRAKHYFLENHVPLTIGGMSNPYEFNLPQVGTVDIKTKRVNSQPHPGYAVEVREIHIEHPVNIFLFCYWLPPTVYMLGWLEKREFLLNSRVFKRGNTRFGPNGQSWVCKEDCRVAEIRDLHPVSEILLLIVGRQGSLL